MSQENRRCNEDADPGQAVRAKRKHQWFCQYLDGFGNRCNASCPDGETECNEHYVDPETPRDVVAVSRNSHWRKNYKQCVYFVRCDSLGALKIGTARSVTARFAALEQACPAGLTLVGFIAGGEQVERWLHYHCFEDRMRLEWFHWSERVQSIAKLVLAHGMYAAETMCPRYIGYDRAREAGRNPRGMPLPPLPSRAGYAESFLAASRERRIIGLRDCGCALCREGQ